MTIENLNVIVAMDNCNGIGKDNKLPWHLPSDLKYFKNVTKGNVVAMGRKTFESIGKPLTQRDNVIITRQQNYCAKGCLVINSVEALISLSQKLPCQVYVIGGREIIEQVMPYVNRLYLTRIYGKFDCDTKIDDAYLTHYDWSLLWSKHVPIDEENQYAHDFDIWQKK